MIQILSPKTIHIRPTKYYRFLTKEQREADYSLSALIIYYVLAIKSSKQTKTPL